METNRLGSTRDEKARVSLEVVIKFLKAQVSDIDSQMLEIVRSNLELKTLDELLQSIPGVGPVLSATLLSSLPELGGDSRGALSFLVGVAPLNHDSDHARSATRCCFKGKIGAFYGQEVVRTVECDSFVVVERMCVVRCTWGLFRLCVGIQHCRWCTSVLSRLEIRGGLY